MSTDYSITVQVSCFRPSYVSRVCSPALSGYSWNFLEDTERIHICDICLTWFHVTFTKYVAKEREQRFIEQLHFVKLKTYISLLNMNSNN